MASVSSLNTVQQFYIAYYQRPADPSGLLYWADRLDVQGGNIDEVDDAFGTSAESTALYGPINSTTIGGVIDAVYLALFDRLPDAAGKQFYIDGFNAGTFTPASLAYNILIGAQNDDAVAVQNKTLVANRFTEAVDGRPLSDPNFGQGTTFAATYAGEADAIAARAWLADVTSNPVTIPSESQTVEFIQDVIADPGDPILLVIPGQTFALTPSVDIINATLGNDLVVGVFGSATAGENTYTVGDSIIGGAANDTLSLTAAGTLASPNAVTVKSVEAIVIRDLVGSTFDATLVSDSPTISFTDTLAGQTSTVVGGSLGSVYGLAGAGNMTVDFASTSGTSDTAKLSVASAGTSTSARSTIDVSDGGTIEAVSLDLSGTNFLLLNAGSAAKLTMTGAGTNNVSIGTMAAVATIDASATTGTNTIGLLPGTLNTGDTIKGGTGADTLNAKFTGAVLANPTISGVESLGLEFDGAATLNLSKTTGATTVTMTGNDADATITNADASLVNLKVLNQGSPGWDVTFGHAIGVTAPLTMQIGGATGAAATNVNLDTVTLNGTTSLTLNAVGTKDYTIDELLLTADQDSVAISVADGADLRITPLNAQGNDVDALSVTVGEGAFFSGTFQMSGGDLGGVDISVGENGESDIFMTTSSGGGSVGQVNISAIGTNATSYNYLYVSAGDVAGISLTADGTNAVAWLNTLVSGGSVGDIDVSIDGTDVSGHLTVSANAFAFDAVAGDGGGGNIGDVTIDVQGTSNFFSFSGDADGGDIGDISVSMQGVQVSGRLDFEANWLSGDVDNDGSADDYVRGGNIGDVTIDINGVGAEVDIGINASGGNMGAVSYSLQGATASGVLELNATSGGSGSDGGNIGPIDIVLGDNVDFSGSIGVEISTGAISILAGENVSGNWGMSGGSDTGLQLGDLTLNMGDNSSFTFYTAWISGATGAFDMNLGEGDYLDMRFSRIDGNVGPVTVTAGNFADVTVESVFGGTIDSFDAITLIGGEGGSGLVDFGTTVVTSFGGVDATQWLGALDVNLAAVGAGTVVTTGAAGSSITGTAFADNIFGGAGVDTVDAGGGDDTVTAGGGNDVITGGTGADILQGDAGNDTFNVAAIADFASGEVVAGGAGTDALVFAAAGAITYVGRTVTSVETLDLTPGAGNAVVVVQGTGLVTVKDLNVVGAMLTLNQGATAFDAAAQANAAAVNVAGEWYYNGTGADNGLLSYFDQTANVAVTVTLVGVETAALTGGVAEVGGNLVFTQA